MPWQKMRMIDAHPTIDGKEINWRDFHAKGISEKKPKALVASIMGDEIWQNDIYQASVRRVAGPAWFDETEECFNGFGGVEVTWISIRRLDRAPAHDWRDFQNIKNDIVGAESEAIELYPAESRLMDTTNQYHLFAFDPDPSNRPVIPVGFTKREVREKTFGFNSKQRRFQ